MVSLVHILHINANDLSTAKFTTANASHARKAASCAAAAGPAPAPPAVALGQQPFAVPVHTFLK